MKLFSLYNDFSKSPVSGGWKVCNFNKLFKALLGQDPAWQVACNSEGLAPIPDARII